MIVNIRSKSSEASEEKISLSLLGLIRHFLGHCVQFEATVTSRQTFTLSG